MSVRSKQSLIGDVHPDRFSAVLVPLMLIEELELILEDGVESWNMSPVVDELGGFSGRGEERFLDGEDCE